MEPGDPECTDEESFAVFSSSKSFLSLGGRVSAHLVTENNNEAIRQQLYKRNTEPEPKSVKNENKTAPDNQRSVDKEKAAPDNQRSVDKENIRLHLITKGQ